MTGRFRELAIAAAGSALVAASLVACSSADADDTASAPVVSGAFLGEADAGRAAALYLTIDQRGGDDRLVGVRTDVSDVVGVMPGDMAMDDPMTDRSVDVPIAAGDTVDFAPGDDHLMLIDVSRGLVPGDNVSVTLVFERHGEVTVQATTLSLLDINERVADRRDAEGGSDR